MPLSYIPGIYNIQYLAEIVSLLLAISLQFLSGKKTGTVSNGVTKYIVLGGIIIGSTGFILGFFETMIIDPHANQGPLLGIFITGPPGFLVGLMGGGIYWYIKVRSKRIDWMLMNLNTIFPIMGRK